MGARAFVDAGRDEFDRERTNIATHEITPETINVLGTNDGAYYPDGIWTSSKAVLFDEL
jgi:hypothetical protein